MRCELDELPMRRVPNAFRVWKRKRSENGARDASRSVCDEYRQVHDILAGGGVVTGKQASHMEHDMQDALGASA